MGPIIEHFPPADERGYHIAENSKERVLEQFRVVFTSHKDEFEQFLENIYQQLDKQKFFTLIEEILQMVQNGEDLYHSLQKRLSEAKIGGFSRVKASLRSLCQQQKAVSEQTHALLKNNTLLHSYVEIGPSGRHVRPIKEKLNLQGKVTVIAPKPRSIADLLQCGFPRPYQEHCVLNEYTPLQMKEESVDLISCFIGLHHCPKEKLEEFVTSIAKTLRPGGNFLLRDHQAEERSIHAIADVVHTVINADDQESWETEEREVRNFQSLDYWKELCKNSGLVEVEGQPLIREGDPTGNSMLRFVKPVEESSIESIAKTWLSNISGYKRSQAYTHMKNLEWHIVDVAEEYANTPLHAFPFFSHLPLFWKTFAESWKIAREDGHSFSELFFSDDMLMNAFIGLLSSLEFAVKGVLFAPLKLAGFSHTTKAGEVDAEVAKEYANFLKPDFFFNFPYLQNIPKFWVAFAREWKQTAESGRFLTVENLVKQFVNLYTALIFTLEYAVKGAVALPVRIFQALPFNMEEKKILALIEERESLDVIEGIEVVKEFYGSSWKVVKVAQDPNYEPVTSTPRSDGNALRRLAQKAKIHEISGNSTLQIKVLAKSAVEFERIGGVKQRGKWESLFNAEQENYALDIEVGRFHEASEAIKRLGGKIRYVHDF